MIKNLKWHQVTKYFYALSEDSSEMFYDYEELIKKITKTLKNFGTTVQYLSIKPSLLNQNFEYFKESC